MSKTSNQLERFSSGFYEHEINDRILLRVINERVPKHLRGNELKKMALLYLMTQEKENYNNILMEEIQNTTAGVTVPPVVAPQPQAIEQPTVKTTEQVVDKVEEVKEEPKQEIVEEQQPVPVEEVKETVTTEPVEEKKEDADYTAYANVDVS